MLADYEDAIRCSTASGISPGPRSGWRAACAPSPTDRLAALYLTRAQECLAQAPAEDWDAVRLMTTK